MKETRTNPSETLTSEQAQIIKELVNCALACDSCSSRYLTTAAHLTRCIELARDCADMCFLGSRLMMRNSELGDEMLRVCEEACRVCAEECLKYDFEYCRICAEACESCANSCQEYHNLTGGTHP